MDLKTGIEFGKSAFRDPICVKLGFEFLTRLDRMWGDCSNYIDNELGRSSLKPGRNLVNFRSFVYVAIHECRRVTLDRYVCLKRGLSLLEKSYETAESKNQKGLQNEYVTRANKWLRISLMEVLRIVFGIPTGIKREINKYRLKMTHTPRDSIWGNYNPEYEIKLVNTHYPKVLALFEKQWADLRLKISKLNKVLLENPDNKTETVNKITEIVNQ